MLVWTYILRNTLSIFILMAVSENVLMQTVTECQYVVHDYNTANLTFILS